MTETTNAANRMAREFEQLSLQFIEDLQAAWGNDSEVSEQLAAMTTAVMRLQSTANILEVAIDKIDELRIKERRKGFRVVKSG